MKLIELVKSGRISLELTANGVHVNYHGEFTPEAKEEVQQAVSENQNLWEELSI